jgi:hypothetical protein
VAGVPVLALAGERLEDRGLRLLELEEERVVVVAAHEQCDPGSGPHAHDPHHLASEVHEAVARQQALAIGGERCAVLAQALVGPFGESGRLVRGQELGDGDDERRVAQDARFAVHLVGQLVEGLQAVLVRALATFFSARRATFAGTAAR